MLLSTLFLTTASAQEYVHTHTLTKHTDIVWSIAFKDNSTLISGSRDHTLRAWNVDTGEQRWDRDVGSPVYTVAMPAHGPFFVAYGGADNEIRMRYTNDGSWRGSFDPGYDWVHDLAFKPNSYILASGHSGSGTISIWDVRNRDDVRHVRTLRGHTDAVDSVAWSPNGQTLASASRDGTLRLWDPNNGINFAMLRGHTGKINSLVWSPDGRLLASRSDDGTVRIWDMDTERTLHVIMEDGGNHNSVAFHPDGQTLAIGGYQEISLWNPHTGQHIATLTGHTDWINAVVWSPDGQTLASSSVDTTIRLWRISTPPSPEIVFESQKIDDTGSGAFGWSKGNSNGVVEVGEQITFTVTLRNVGEIEAKNVKGTLSAKDKSIGSIIVEGEVDYGNIGIGKVSPAPLLDIARSFKLKIPSILTSQDATFTLTLTADNGGPWTIPITISIVNPVSIGIEFPDNLISEEAFSDRSIYFVLTAAYPQLTGVSDADVHYEDCTITLHIPQHTQPFIFPIKTEGEEALGTALDIAITIAGLKVPIISAIATLIDLFADIADLIDDLEALQTLDLNIELPTVFGSGAGQPNQAIDFIVLLQLKTMPLESIEITIEQKYRFGDRGKTNEVADTRRWYFDAGWAAPAASPLALSDYPPFQLLPLELQQYFLRQFSEFATVETWRIPDETAMEQNYPNPFNPETWIPYQLSEPAEVKLTIYAANGTVVRTLALGHQPAGLYQSRSRAAYWDGRNELGMQVTSGLYFYTFTADDFSATGKMVVAK